MKHVKNSITLLLAALLLASCGNGTTENKETTPVSDTDNANNVEETEEQTGRKYTKDNLPDDLDFGGAALRIQARGGDDDTRSEFYAEEATGEVLNDAVYERNNLVMERLNVVLETELSDMNRHGGDQELIRQTVLGGTDDFEIIANMMAYTVPLTVEGMFINQHTLPYLDFDMPWWNSSFIDSSTIYDRTYLSIGDLSQTMISGTFAMFFNSTLYEEYYADSSSLFEIVRNGEWTLDTMISLCGEMYQDSNGNSEADEGDIFGNYYYNDKMLASDAYVGGCNIEILTFDESGNLQYNGNSERMMTFLEKLTKLIFEGNNTYRGPYNDDTIMEPMLNRITLFNTWMLGATTYLRDMDDDFGIIPMPKLDENQSEYSASIHDGSTVLGIPVTCQNTELAAAGLEALSAESYRRVTSAYFDKVLKGKYSRDAETAEMLDLLVSSIKPDTATIFGYLLGAPVDMIRGFMGSLNENAKAVSTLAASEKTIMNKMEAVMEDYAKLP